MAFHDGLMPDRVKDWAHDLLRTLVLKTNPLFPFTYCNRWPYYASLQAITSLVRRRPEVRSLYLRHSLAPKGWTPALSDIDLTLILERSLTARREFDFIDSFRRRYRGLKRFLPMLGELEILGEDDFEPWLRSTGNSPAGRPWTLLHGQPILDPSSAPSPHWRVSALNFSLWVYFDLLPPVMSKRDSYLRRVDVRRRVMKIIRVLRPILAEHGERELPIHPEAGEPLLIAHAAKALEAAVAHVDCGAPCDAPDARWFPSHANCCDFDSNRPASLSGARSAIAFQDKVVVIIAAGLGPEQVAGTAAASRKEWALPPVLLPENVFRYMLRRYNPYDYSWLFRSRKIAFGTDPLDGMPPPGRAEFTAHLLSRLGHILAFTRGEELFPDSGLLPVHTFEKEVGRLMGIRLLLQRNWITPYRHQLDAEWRREFPECSHALEEIKLAAATGRNVSASRQEAFAFFRSLASEVRNAVMVMQP
jgi:hypothetical protein